MMRLSRDVNPVIRKYLHDSQSQKECYGTLFDRNFLLAKEKCLDRVLQAESVKETTITSRTK